jgi:hypothetical protein
MKLIAEGNSFDLASIENYEDNYPEGSQGELRLFTSVTVPDEAIQMLQNELDNQGVEMWDRVQQAHNTVLIRFKKGFPWLAVIIGVLLGLIVLLALITMWQLFQVTTTGEFFGMPVITWVFGGIVAILVYKLVLE